MRSLYLRIFISFWLTVIIAGVITAVVTYTMNPKRPFASHHHFANQALAQYGKGAVDVFQNEGAAGLAAYVRREKELGFDGIGCIHPRQIPVVHREMAPSEAAVARALAVVRAAREAEARGLGAVALGSKMVDPPVVKQAFRTVELAVAAGLLAADWEEGEA